MYFQNVDLLTTILPRAGADHLPDGLHAARLPGTCTTRTEASIPLSPLTLGKEKEQQENAEKRLRQHRRELGALLAARSARGGLGERQAREQRGWRRA